MLLLGTTNLIVHILFEVRAIDVHQYNVENDSIGFKVKPDKKPLTKPGIVSTVSAIHGPLGLMSLVTLHTKALVQRLCRLNIGWDDQMPEFEDVRLE